MNRTEMRMLRWIQCVDLIVINHTRNKTIRDGRISRRNLPVITQSSQAKQLFLSYAWTDKHTQIPSHLNDVTSVFTGCS